MAALLASLDGLVLAWLGVFARVAAVAFLLPGMGEQAVPARVRLGGAVAFTAVIGPLVIDGPLEVADGAALAGLLGAEALAGLLIGISIRLALFAIQTAGAIAAQSISVAQMFGGLTGGEPEPVFATILGIAAITAALATGLHVEVAAALALSYEVVGFGRALDAADLGAWSAARGAVLFDVAVGLALPFVVTGFLYNCALGAINRAMPQMMVAFVGAPAITLAGIGLLLVTTPLVLTVWLEHLHLILARPFEARP